jgi:Gpi18-like mannosyltransferase
MLVTAAVLAAAQQQAVPANLMLALAVSAAAQGIAQVLPEPKYCGWFYSGIR